METRDFFSYIRSNPLLFKTDMTAGQVDGTLAILTHLTIRQVEDDRIAAYICATAFNDANQSMNITPGLIDHIIEGAVSYFTDDLTDWTGARALVAPDMAGASAVARTAIVFRSAIIHASNDFDE